MPHAAPSTQSSAALRPSAGRPRPQRRIAHATARPGSGGAHRTVGPLSFVHASRIEAAEAEVWADLYRAAPHAIRASEGLSLRAWGPLLASAAAAHDALAFNRIVWNGETDGLSAAWLRQAVHHYRRLGVRKVFFACSPAIAWAFPQAALTELGFRPYNRWMKLWRTAAPAPRVDSELSAEPVGRDDAADVRAILAACFNYPAPLSGVLGSTVGAQGWRHFGVRRGGRLVAAAGLCIHRGVGWLGPAATLPEHRGLGAQKVLIARRIEAAREAGCTLLCTETAEPHADRPSPSLHNLRRMGFRVAYRRPNHLLELDRQLDRH